MSDTFVSLWDLIFPRYCLLCDKRLSPTERHICITCLDSLPRTNGHTIAHNAMEQMYWGLVPIAHATAFFYYNANEVRTIVKKAKYHKHPAVAQYIAKLMTTEMLDSDFFSDIDIIIPMPLHRHRQMARGYNQSDYIAQGVSQATHLPVATDAVCRIVDTESQTHKSVISRHENVKDIFSVKDKTAIADKHVLIVDDVITSGATTKSLAETIAAAGCRKISVLSMSYSSASPLIGQP